MLRKIVRLGYPRVKTRGYSYLKGYVFAFFNECSGLKPAAGCSNVLQRC